MLQTMRKLSKSWFSTVLLGGLALSFALWGIGDIFQGRVSTAVASVGSTEIDQADFSRDYRNTVRMLGQRQQTEITQEEARKMGLPQNTLARIMDETALNNLAADLGLSISDETVTREIQSIPAFQGVTGTFDQGTFQQRIGQLNYTEAQFITLMRRDLARAQLRSAIEDGLSAPPGYVAALMSYFNEARVAEYVVVAPDSLGAIAPPSDQVLAAYVAAHPAQFSTPEYRSVTYAAIGPEDVIDKLKVSDAQLRAAYDQNKATYVVPEKRDADQISFLSEAEAKAARAKIDGGMTYDALATERKLSAKTISMGSVSKDQITEKAQADAVFSLPENGISQPVKGPFGWVIVRVRKITPAINKTFDEAKPELEKTVKAELAASTLVDVVNKFTDAQGSGDDIAQAGKAAGMHIVSIGAMDANGLGPDGAKVDAPATDDFRKAVFAAEVGVDGDAFQTTDGHYYGLKVGGVTPPKLKSLTVVHDAALAAWMRDERSKALAQKADALAAQANRDHRLSGTVQTTGRITRESKSDVLSVKLVNALFSKPAGVAVTGPLGKGEGYVVARTVAVGHDKISPTDPNYRGIGRALSRQISSDMSQSLAAAEKTRQKSEINQKLLDQAVGAESS